MLFRSQKKWSKGYTLNKKIAIFSPFLNPVGVKEATFGLSKKFSENNFSVDVLKDFNADTTNYNSDIHASAKYRGNLVKVLLEEAILELA